MNSTVSRTSVCQVRPPAVPASFYLLNCLNQSESVSLLQAVNWARPQSSWCSRTLVFRFPLALVLLAATRSAAVVLVDVWRTAWRCPVLTPTSPASWGDRGRVRPIFFLSTCPKSHKTNTNRTLKYSFSKSMTDIFMKKISGSV